MSIAKWMNHHQRKYFFCIVCEWFLQSLVSIITLNGMSFNEVESILSPDLAGFW